MKIYEITFRELVGFLTIFAESETDASTTFDAWYVPRFEKQPGPFTVREATPETIAGDIFLRLALAYNNAGVATFVVGHGWFVLPATMEEAGLAYLDRRTFVQANVRSGGRVIPLVQREEDERFRSVFISSDPGITKLADLKGKDLSFGSQSSTSGHLMPRSYLLQAGVDPDKDLKRVAYSGAHDATIAAVASGKVVAGALNISVWDKFVADKKVDTSKVHVFFTTPPYFDYNWTVHADMPAALRDKLSAAFLALSRDSAEGKEVLDLQRAARFVPTKAENYKGIETAARSAGLL